MKISDLTHISMERLSGVVTILVVSSMSLYIMFNFEELDTWQKISAPIFYLIYLALFLVTTIDRDWLSEKHYMGLVGIQLLSLFGIFFTVPIAFNAILMGIWCGHMVYIMSLRNAVLVSFGLSFLFFAIFTWYWKAEHIIYSTMLYVMLNIFTMVMINATRVAILAREESLQLNSELLAAQSLLKEATKQSERIRIARNIHDLVGHHLTALTINLQVAMLKSDGEAKRQVEKSYAIAKLLLADVREAVSEIREKSNIELHTALKSLVQSVPRLEVELDLQENLEINDVELADTLVKCVQESITNSLKHSRCSRFKVELCKSGDELVLNMSDNGGEKAEFNPGNGLTGIKERVAAFKGRVEFRFNQTGFETQIAIPQAV